jgi:hypothetical protein
MCIYDLFPKWLKERGGIVVYENHMMDSSRLGDRTYMPARYVASEDNQLHDAPEEYRPNGGLPSLRQQKVDKVTLGEFGGDLEQALACFRKEEEEKPKRSRR